MSSDQLAIIGLSCRFPHAEDEYQYWQLLKSGGSGIEEIPRNRWRADDFYHQETGVAGKMNTRWGGFLSDIDGFDASLFGIPSHEAARMDPQQRLSMEIAWEALEDAGIFPPSLAGSETAVVLGIAHNDHSRLLYRDLGTIDAYNGTNTYLCVAANRLSYALDLKGPSMAIDTACSSSLYALSTARAQLLSGRTDCVLVGGVNLNLSPEEFISLSHAGLMDGEGQCKTFDACADGYVRGEGAGFLVVRRLEDALRDKNRIRAIVCGESINANGRTFGLTAPRGDAQKALLQRAWENADLDVTRLGMVEVNGTATLMGDRIELNALAEALSLRRVGKNVEKNIEKSTEESTKESTKEKAQVFVGTAKTNIGHLEAAAGMAGIIKIILAMQHATIPPHRNMTSPADGLPLGKQLHIPLTCQPWDQHRQVFGAVSAFGFGGANAHVVLANKPSLEAVQLIQPPIDSTYPLYALMLSAQTPNALQQQLLQLQKFVSEHTISIGALARSLTSSRAGHKEKLAIMASSNDDLLDTLKETTFQRAELRATSSRNSPKVAFIQHSIDGSETDDEHDCEGKNGTCDKYDGTLSQCFRSLDINISERLSTRNQPAEHTRTLNTFLDERSAANKPGAWLLINIDGHIDKAVSDRCKSLGFQLLTDLDQEEKYVSQLRILMFCWLAGVKGKWERLWENEELVSLPTYPFQHERYPREPYTAIISSTEKCKLKAAEKTPAEHITKGILVFLNASSDQERVADVDIDVDIALVDLGFDSIRLTSLKADLVYRYGVLIEDVFQVGITISQLADKISQALSQTKTPQDKRGKQSVTRANFSYGTFPELEMLDARLDSFEGELPFFTPMDHINSATTYIDGKEIINFSSYNYLGLSGHPSVCADVSEAIAQYGTSVSASRLVGGECYLHGLLETEISDFLGTEAAIVFVGGHTTNVSVLGHLAGPEDFICFDELIHNSCVEGVLRSGARYRPFLHNNMQDLQQIVSATRDSCRRLFIIAEGVYSMDGDTVPLQQFVDIAKQWDCVSMVDEAHSLGTIGRTGRGISEYCEVAANQVDILMGTLSKSLGSCGGYIAANAGLVRYLKYTCPGFVYSVGISPANTAAARGALKILRQEPQRCSGLQKNAMQLRAMLQAQGWNTGSSTAATPVVPLIIGSEKRCIKLSKYLMKKGIHVQPVLPPAVAEEASRLRFFITKEHTSHQLDVTLQHLKEALHEEELADVI